MVRALIALLVTILVMGGIVFFAVQIFDNTDSSSDHSSPSDVHLEGQEDVIIFSPEEQETVGAQIALEGVARGFWFFEANTNADVIAPDGEILGSAIVFAVGEWMTESYVPFIAAIDINRPYEGLATLVFHKANASGLPEHDDQVTRVIRVSVSVISGKKAGAYDGCVITGCSSQVCSGDEVITTCEYRPEYACYTDAVCELQENGECGWTQSSALNECLLTNRFE